MAFRLAEAYVQFSQRGVIGVKSGVDGIKGSFARASASLNVLAAGVAALGTGAAFNSLMGFVNAAAEAEKQTAKLEAVLKSTQGVSGQTIETLEAHASALQRVTAFEDDTIKGAQAVLLTFRKISGETFPQATEAALDLATVFETDLRSAALTVGKALEDPARGLMALRRVGVTFTKDQEAVIKSLVETGRVAEAQAAILKEIQGQVGGSARKVGDTTFGQIEQFKNEIGDLAELIGGELTPAIRAASDTLKAWRYALGGQGEMIKDFQKETGGLAKQFSEAKTSKQAEDAQRSYYQTVKRYQEQGLDMRGQASFFGSYAAQARIADLRGQETARQRTFDRTTGLAGRAAGLGADVLRLRGGNIEALVNAVSQGAKETKDFLRENTRTSFAQEELLKRILEKLPGPTDNRPRFQ